MDITTLVHEIKAVRGAHQVALYTLKGTEVTLQEIIKDHSIEIPGNDKRLSSNNIIISIKEAQDLLKLTEDEIRDELMRIAIVQAVSTIDNSPVDITQFAHTLKAVAGTYTADFATAKDSAITVEVIVRGNTGEDLQNGEREIGRASCRERVYVLV